MTITMLKAKIHRAIVTQAELDYVGSITVDMDLLEQAGILEYEKVQIVDVNNGSRSPRTHKNHYSPLKFMKQSFTIRFLRVFRNLSPL